MKRYILGIFLIIICFANISAKKKTSKENISGSYHLIQFLDNGSMRSPELEQNEFDINLKAKRINLNIGCNQIAGTFILLAKNKLEPFNLISTRMACPTLTESNFVNCLSQVNGYQVNKNQLILLDGLEKLVILERGKVNVVKQIKSKLNGSYKLNSLLINGKMKNDKYDKSKIEIYANKQQIACTVGCNRIGGSWIEHNAKVEKLNLMMTEMYCEKYDLIERNFVEQLGLLTHYKVKGSKLFFYNQEQLIMELDAIQE